MCGHDRRGEGEQRSVERADAGAEHPQPAFAPQQTGVPSKHSGQDERADGRECAAVQADLPFVDEQVLRMRLVVCVVGAETWVRDGGERRGQVVGGEAREEAS